MRTYNTRKLISKKHSRRGGASATGGFNWGLWGPILIGAAGVGHQVYSTNKEAERAAKMEERRLAIERQDRLDDIAREKERYEEERRERQKSKYRDEDEYDEPPRRPAKKPRKPKYEDDYDEPPRRPSKKQPETGSKSGMSHASMSEPKVYRGKLVPPSLSETEAKRYQMDIINGYKSGRQRNARIPEEYYEYISNLSPEEKSQNGLQ